jgi:hypothetical protein
MQSMVERRSEQRENPVLRGPAVIIAGSVSVEISILNTSREGLMIRVPANAAVPATFTLKIGDYLQACQLVWRHGKLLGARLAV